MKLQKIETKDVNIEYFNNHEDNTFLCKKDDMIFSSSIRYESNYGIYVDCIRLKKVILIDELDEFYLIME